MRGKASFDQVPCAVCQQQTKGYHFGVQSCRACASFFRRAIAEEKHYKCYRNNDCNISNGSQIRNSCRGCRFAKCIKAGMFYDLSTAPIKRSDSLPNLTNISSSTEQKIDPKSADFSLLNRLTHGYKAFIRAQKAIFEMEFYDEIKTGVQHIEITKLEALKFEKMTMPFLYTMFDKYYKPMSSIAREDKVRLIENHWQTIGMFHRAYITRLTFPDIDDKRICTAPGIYLNLQNIRGFLKGVAPDELLDDYMNNATCMPIFDAMDRFVRKFKKLQIRDVDSAALMCIALWADAEKMGIESDEIDEFKEQVTIEWMKNLSHEHGEIEAGLRMAKMLCFLMDLDEMTTILKDAALVVNVCWPKDMNHMLKEMSLDRQEYLKILRQTDANQSKDDGTSSINTQLPDF